MEKMEKLPGPKTKPANFQVPLEIRPFLPGSSQVLELREIQEV